MTQKHQILVVEDGAGEREALARLLRIEGYEVATARDANHAMTLVDQPIDLVITDLRMGGRTGIDLLSTWRVHRPNTPFVVITAYGDVETAVTAMKLGARDFLTKPVDPNNLLEIVRSSIPPQPIRESSEAPLLGADRLLGNSAAMQRIRDQIRRVAATDSSVLILGESSTGKELAAEAIHYHSERVGKPFVVVNMAALPDSLVESELFGHMKGAFTGATTDRIGRFETASEGTLFIDEIAEFPLASQAKLLRALETHVVQRVGSNEDYPARARLVAATSRDLRQMVRERSFREDLYYRLNVVTLEIPPLRERRDEIALLIDHFLMAIARSLSQPAPPLEPELLAFLIDYPWPGNVRQLRNCLESMLVLHSEGPLGMPNLPPDLLEGRETLGSNPNSEASRLERLERSAILQTLHHCGGNRTRAAEILGISVRTLQRRLKQWGQD